jgi:uncharacterized membrane protein
MIISAGIFYSAMDFPMGAEVFPKFLAGSMFLLSAVMLLTTIRSYTKLRAAEEAPEQPQAEKKHIILPFVVFAIIFIYVVLIPITGFFTISLLFIITILRLLEVKRIKHYLLTTVILIGGIYFLFVMQLNIPVPQGFLI